MTHSRNRDGPEPVFTIPANYYRQFDADYSLEVPGEGFGGWAKAEIELSAPHTAFVVMHAWDCGTFQQFPGVWRSVEYLPRSDAIAREVFPRLLSAIRASDMHLFHVVGGGDYYRQCPGYLRARELAGPPPQPPPQAPTGPTWQQLHNFRSAHVWRGAHNQADGFRLQQVIDFYPQARPLDEEGVAEDSHQLFALCAHAGVNHLIYTGFCIDCCLLISPGGMVDMSRHGIICSAIRQAVTAVENRETARTQTCKEIGLWRVATQFGFVFDLDDVLAALAGRCQGRQRRG